MFGKFQTFSVCEFTPQNSNPAKKASEVTSLGKVYGQKLQKKTVSNASHWLAMTNWLVTSNHQPTWIIKTHFQLLLGVALVLDRHLVLVLLEVLSLGRLQIKPGVAEVPNVGQQRLDERVVFVLWWRFGLQWIAIGSKWIEVGWEMGCNGSRHIEMNRNTLNHSGTYWIISEHIEKWRKRAINGMHWL